jgi:hypothetical protein
MLPRSLTPLITLPSFLHFLFGLVSVDICIDVGVSIDVDVDLSTIPIRIAPRIPPSRAHGHPRAEHHRG